MYCVNCGSKNEENAQFCTSCGNNLQNGLVNNNLNQENIMINNKKNDKTLPIIIGIIGVFVIIGIIIGLNNKQEDLPIGTYLCGTSKNNTDTNNSMIFTINADKTFIMSYGQDEVSGKYQITNVVYDETINSKKYELELIANNRYINGIKNTEEYKTNYELAVSGSNEAVLVNTKTMNLYYCDKK